MRLFLPTGQRGRQRQEGRRKHLALCSVSLSVMGLPTPGGRSSFALSLQDLGDQSAPCEMEKKKNKKGRDELRTALQEFGREQSKLSQAARSTRLGSKLHLAGARTKAVSAPSALLHGCPVCTEVRASIVLSTQLSAHLLLKQSES